MDQSSQDRIGVIECRHFFLKRSELSSTNSRQGDLKNETFGYMLKGILHRPTVTDHEQTLLPTP